MKCRSHSILLVAGLILALQSSFVRAETIDSVAYILESVVVYGDRFVPASSLVEINLKEIESLNAATVADALRSLPGLIVTSGPKAETESRIRGFAASNVLVLVDGRPINPGYYGKVDLSMLPVDNIARITVVKGPSEVAYGANAMGGVISIITKNGSESPSGSVTGEFGDHGYRKISLNHGLRKGTFNYWLSAYEHHSHGYRLSSAFDPTQLEDGGVREHSSYSKVGLEGKLGFETSPRFQSHLSFSYHWAEKDIAPTIYTWDGPSYREFPEWRRSHFTASSRWGPRPGLDLKVSLYADWYHDRLINYLTAQRAADAIDYDSRLRNSTIGAVVDIRKQLRSNQTVSTTIHFKRDLMKKQPDIGENWISGDTYTGSGTLQWDWRPAHATVISLGGGYHYFRPGQSGSRTSFVSPLLSVRHTLPLRLKSHACYARALRYPTIHELYSESSGNIDLRPQFADKYEIGIERWFTAHQGRGFVRLGVTAFYNELSDLIYRESQSYRFRNIGTANLYGWEIEAQFGMSDRLKTTIGFSRLRSSKSQTEMMESNPRNALQFLLTLGTAAGLEVNYELRNIGRRTTYLPHTHLTAYSLHNMNVAYWPARAVGLRLELNNLTDQDYQEELGYPAPGRQVVISITGRLSTGSLLSE